MGRWSHYAIQIMMRFIGFPVPAVRGGAVRRIGCASRLLSNCVDADRGALLRGVWVGGRLTGFLAWFAGGLASRPTATRCSVRKQSSDLFKFANSVSYACIVNSPQRSLSQASANQCHSVLLHCPDSGTRLAEI